MNNLNLTTMPTIVTGIIIFFGAGIVLSFITLFFILIKNKGETKARIALYSLFLSLVLFPISIVSSSFAGSDAIKNHEYEIIKTDKDIIIQSKSEFIKNRTYELIAHKNDYYYLEYNGDFYKISDKEFEQKIEKVNKVTAYKSVK